jgi:hypothetical protein
MSVKRAADTHYRLLWASNSPGMLARCLQVAGSRSWSLAMFRNSQYEGPNLFHHIRHEQDPEWTAR